MNIEYIRLIVEMEIRNYVYEEPEPGTTLGKPWSEEKVLSYIPKLKNALVKPYIQRFLLDENVEHFGREVYADYWVVAIEDDCYYVWCDPEAREFGLGIETTGGEFISIKRGDLVGVYCSI